jgi:tRNA-Thr(GGU) m(6)t(6)A37 methyltransferase TsaA
MEKNKDFSLQPIGIIRSSLTRREDAPRQGHEGGPEAVLEISPEFMPALEGVEVGDELILITWFHLSKRDVLRVHPRGDRSNPLAGVFATRSPDRPNPLGLHRVKLLEIAGTKLRIGPIEALDGTPVLDIKPVLRESADS